MHSNSPVAITANFVPNFKSPNYTVSTTSMGDAQLAAIHQPTNVIGNAMEEPTLIELAQPSLHLINIEDTPLLKLRMYTIYTTLFTISGELVLVHKWTARCSTLPLMAKGIYMVLVMFSNLLSISVLSFFALPAIAACVLYKTLWVRLWS